MSLLRSLLCVVAALSLCTFSSVHAEVSAHTLPIFFFHGVTANASSGNNMKANLSTDARPFVSLTFCQSACSLGELNHQTDLAIAQIRGIVANDSRYDNGYVFIGHSQGSALARSVIETMDDHKVHTFISLAGAANGIFYGPQTSDFVPAVIYLDYFAPVMLNKTQFDYTQYTHADILSGKLQIATAKFFAANPQLQYVGSGYELSRSPVASTWISYSPFFPVLNNLQSSSNTTVAAGQAQRKKNFLKLQAAHFFASPFDDTISPWQSSILGKYNDVATIEDLETGFSNLTIMPMTATSEYTQDLYGLKTLDTRGGLFLHTVQNISHSCWVADSVSPRTNELCHFLPNYEQNVYPLLAPPVRTYC